MKMCICMFLFLPIALYTMDNKELTHACKEKAFGITRKTNFDKKLEKKINVLQKSNPEKYNRIVAAASKQHTNTNQG